jgi:hypothetical protein
MRMTTITTTMAKMNLIAMRIRTPILMRIPMTAIAIITTTDPLPAIMIMLTTTTIIMSTMIILTPVALQPSRSITAAALLAYISPA